MSRVIGVPLAFVAIAVAGLCGSAHAATEPPYRAELSPTPHTLATRADVMGAGLIVATLTGHTLTIDGSYAGLPSDATKAHLHAAAAMGVPGARIADLAVSGGRAGRITGQAKLGTRQRAALRAGGLSIVLDSVNAPKGNLWGWLAAGSRRTGE